jgi:HSP20 family protein
LEEEMAKEQKGKKPEGKGEEPIEVDFGMGKLSLGGVFKGLGNLIEMASKLAEEGEKREGGKEFTFKTPSGKEGRGVFGFSVRTLEEGGKPIVKTFGNIKKTPKGPVVEEVREPMVDVFDEQDRIRVIAELPGVSEEEISVELKGDILNLKAEGRDHKYAKEVLLPAKVEAKSLQKSFRHGILELKLHKA